MNRGMPLCYCSHSSLAFCITIANNVFKSLCNLMHF